MSPRSPSSPRSLLALCALLLALLAPSAARAQDEWDWAEGRVVKRVQWSGLERINPAEALGMIATRPGAAFSSNTLSLDLSRLYRSGRFGSPREGVPPVSVTVRLEGEGVIVELTVHELRPVLRVVFELSDGVKRSDVEALVTTRAGLTFDPFQLERDERAVRKKLQEDGYLHAEISHRVVPQEAGVDLFVTVRAGPQVYVDEIVYEGAEQLDPSVVADAQGPDALETKEREVFGLLEKGVYRPEAMRRDLERIARYYRSQGFLDVQVYLLEERFSLDGEALTLVVGIEEGVRYTVRRVGVEDTKVLDGDQIAALLPLKPGRPFLGEDLRGSLEKIRHLYGQRAYVHARIDADVRYDSERHLLDVDLKVDEGPRVRIEQIKIVGNSKTQEKVIRRELSLYPGEFFDADEVEASIARLGRLNYFSDVRIDFEPGSQPGSEHLLVIVDEARTGSFVLGGGVSTASGFFGNITLNQRNFDLFDVPSSWRDFIEGRAFTGAGQNLTISLQPGRQRSAYSIEFTEPYFLGLPVVFSLEGAIADRARETWLEARRVAKVGLGYRLTQDVVLRATYRIERVRIADIQLDSAPDVIEVAGTNYISALRITLAINKTLVDREFVSYGCWSASAWYEIVGQFLGGDHDFHQAGVEAAYQYLLFAWPGEHKWVLSLRGELTWQRDLKKDAVPIFERVFAGGPGSIRGFRFRTVGPKFLGDNPIGGNFRFTATAEVGFPLFQNVVRGVTFIDAGTVTPSHRDFTRDDLRIAAGFGFRIRVPLFPAPVALDFAWPLKKADDDDEQVFSFAVGFGF